MIVLAVPGGAVTDVVSAHGPVLAVEVVIDAVNRIGEPEFDSRVEVAAPLRTPFM